MCNACGFYCCASDCFGGCGCDHCPDPECWDHADDDDFYDNDDEYETKAPNEPRFICVALSSQVEK
jgi:hypothetical protein